jgi:hypothetical protein
MQRMPKKLSSITWPWKKQRMTGKRPSIIWPSLLRSAPYFTLALFDTGCETPTAEWSPWPRAVIYWELLNSEVRNGGVAQYFYNKSDMPEFDRVPEFIAAHPVLAPHAHFAQTIHEAWHEVAPAVNESRDSTDLFKSLAPKFDALETAFYAINSDIAQALNAHLLAHPHEYFDIAPLQGVAEKGVSWVECQGQGYRGKLRFWDGFPVGPNVFERDDGDDCDVVWFTQNRQVMTSQGYGRRTTIHYPSLRSHEMTFDKEGRLERQRTRRSFRYDHGLDEWFDRDGRIKSSTVEVAGKELLKEIYHSNGQLWMREQSNGEQTLCWRYWPNGHLNTHSIEADGVARYLSCFAEDGSDLAPQGSGTWRQCWGDDGRWREGALVNGLLEGELVWYSADGKAGSKAWFEKGREKSQANQA